MSFTLHTVAHLFYNYHIGKYGKKKTQLTDNVKGLAEQMAREQGKTSQQRHAERRLDGEIANLQLTSFDLQPFKVSKTQVRVEGEEVVGHDTLYRLLKDNSAGNSSKPKKGGAKRKAKDDEEWQSSKRQPSHRKKQPQQQQSESSDSEPEVVCVIPPSQANTRRQSLQIKAEEDSDSDLFSSNENDEDIPTGNEVVSFLPHIPSPNAKPNLHQGKSPTKSSADAAIKNEVIEPQPEMTAVKHDNLFGDEDEQGGETALQEKLAEKDELLNALTKQLDQRNNTISQLSRSLRDKDREIAELKEQLLMICRDETTSSYL